MERDFIREDGSNKLQRISRAYEVLDGLHRRLLGGEVPYPGTLIKFGMNLSDGAQLDITKYDWRLYFRLKKKDGTNLGFGIHTDGLHDISFLKQDNSRCDIQAERLPADKADAFRSISADLTPWFLDIFINNEAKPFPKNVKKAFQSLSIDVPVNF